MMVHLLDGRYELFRHYYGRRRFDQGKIAPFGAVTGVLHTVLEMIEKGGYAPRRGDGPRHRVLPEPSLARLQDGVGSRARAPRAIPPAGRGPRRHGRRRLA